MPQNTDLPSRVVLHEVLLPQAERLNFGARPTATVIRRRYNLEQVFGRGTLVASLAAETDALAAQAVDQFIASALPPTSFDIGSGVLSAFWLNLATCNGHPVERCWKAFPGQRKQHVLTAVELAERDGWLFRLPFWPLPDHLDREPLIFFSDTGLHQRLIVRWEQEEERQAAIQEKIDPAKAASIRRSISHVLRGIANLRFQGFATYALMRAMPNARPFVFDRPSKGEIDLILDGPESERWAVEITNGEPSEKPSRPRMFDQHCEELSIDRNRRRIVYREATASRDRGKAGLIAVTLPRLLAELAERYA